MYSFNVYIPLWSRDRFSSCMGGLEPKYQVNRCESVKRMRFLILYEKAFLSIIILCENENNQRV